MRFYSEKVKGKDPQEGDGCNKVTKVNSIPEAWSVASKRLKAISELNQITSKDIDNALAPLQIESSTPSPSSFRK